MAAKEKGEWTVLTIHQPCDKGERADSDGQPVLLLLPNYLFGIL
jgi:hypothetical protein